MKLDQLKKTLAQNPEHFVRFVLPTGSKIPPHAHVTEVARMDKSFIDCGGKFRSEITCRLQTWFADDTGHRLRCGKLLGILEKSASFLQTENLDVELEYEAPFIAQFPIANVEVIDDALFFQLGVKHTACLAEDKCLPPPRKTVADYLQPIPAVGQSKCCS